MIRRVALRTAWVGSIVRAILQGYSPILAKYHRESASSGLNQSKAWSLQGIHSSSHVKMTNILFNRMRERSHLTSLAYNIKHGAYSPRLSTSTAYRPKPHTSLCPKLFYLFKA
ncbi:hypothetical protein B0J15DRAFT_87091 [Fusarium solani]|uniref:Uncharacterized protein n=1 Tax=Fusarium solani TaxID=169388 RepID=A0A9P9GU40_FUSSL|nr:uncharacterized protein B0J15DRAFT_87091 [Fusarium solani]KAH7244730.1 hypothetical protein B0J15DRAFT_87091 [Fusarium solani]